MLSNVNLSNDLKLLAFGGRVTVSSSYFSPHVFYRCAFSTSFLTAVMMMFFQIVGCRGSVEINPRDTMAKESSIVGVSLFSATKVKWNCLVFSPFRGVTEIVKKKKRKSFRCTYTSALAINTSILFDSLSRTSFHSASLQTLSFNNTNRLPGALWVGRMANPEHLLA